VVFFRKHPGEDRQLQVRWLAQLGGPVETLMRQPDFLRHLHAFDDQTNTVLRALARSLEAMLAMEPQPGADRPAALPADRLRPALHNVLRAIFDDERTRGKVQEWFSNVDDPEKTRAAQSLAGVLRKIEFLNLNAESLGLPNSIGPLDGRFAEHLRERIGDVEGPAPGYREHGPASGGLVSRALRRAAANPRLFAGLLRADRLIQVRLQASGRQRWSDSYGRIRGRILSFARALSRSRR